jgi:hypothetical protein
MSTEKTPLCDAVIAMKNRYGYSPSLNDDEVVINMHFLCKAGWLVDGVAKRHGSSKSLSIQEVVIPLKYNTIYYNMHASCYSLTADEFQLIPITWIDCQVENIDINDGEKPVWHQPMATSSTLHKPDVIPDPDPALIDTTDTRTAQGPLKSALKNIIPLQKVSLLENINQEETSSSNTEQTDMKEARKQKFF